TSLPMTSSPHSSSSDGDTNTSEMISPVLLTSLKSRFGRAAAEAEIVANITSTHATMTRFIPYSLDPVIGGTALAYHDFIRQYGTIRSGSTSRFRDRQPFRAEWTGFGRIGRHFHADQRLQREIEAAGIGTAIDDRLRAQHGRAG